MRPRDLAKSKQKGIMLLEALLGLLIFSLGILAVVGMQAMAIKTVAESKYRMDASFLANEVMGDMWANRSNLGLYAYTGGTPSSVLDRWITKVNNTLPGTPANPPEIAIGAGNEVTVTIYWQHAEEAKLSPAPPPHQYSAIASIN
ncbi:MAG: pilus assembly protein PilV [Pseudomonadota bacterium]